jgi:transposase
MQITTIGLNIAKNVFAVHGIDAAEKVVVRKQLRRGPVLAFFKALPPCLVGMEACATAHYWAREFTKLGHEVRLMPAKDVKAYVKRNKNDAADAEAICEPVRRPTMRFVRIKSAEQQGQLMQHRTRDLLMRQRTQVINALRAHLAELGIVAAQSDKGVKELLALVTDKEDTRLPIDARANVIVLAAQPEATQNGEKYPWLTRLLARRPFKVVAVALANKMARMAWALLAMGHISGDRACGSGVGVWRWEDVGKYVRSRTAGVMKTLMRTVETVDRKTRFWVMRRKSA